MLFFGWLFQELWVSHRSVIWTHGPSDCFLSLLRGYNSWFGRRPGHFLSSAFYLGAANMKNSMKTSLGCVLLITITKAKGPSESGANLLLRRRLCQRMARNWDAGPARPEGEKTNKLITRHARRKAKRYGAIVGWMAGLAGWRRINAPTEWKWAAQVTLCALCCYTCQRNNNNCSFKESPWKFYFKYSQVRFFFIILNNWITTSYCRNFMKFYFNF